MTDDNNLRLDVLISNQNNNLTRSQVRKLIITGRVKVNSVIIKKPAAKIDSKAKILVELPKANSSSFPEIPIIYEDEDVIVINKPAGVLTHSKGSFNEEKTLADWLANKLKIKTENNRYGIVHRLDRGTSGVMILAKNDDAQKWLVKQFSTRKVIKKYIAVILGKPDMPEAIIDMPIERNPKKPQTFRTGSNGKSAQTKYKILSSGTKYSLVELAPTTGRTHQLRVHMSAINHPILGDIIYGGELADRLYLHSNSLEVTLPDKEKREFTAKTPKQFKDII